MTDEAKKDEDLGLTPEITEDDSQWETEAGGELETDAEPTAEPTDDAPAGETTEQKAERDAVYQTKYQAGLEVLDEIDPTGGLSKAFRTGQAPAPQAQPIPVGLTEDGLTIGDLSPAQFVALQRQLQAESAANIRVQVQNENATNDADRAFYASQQRATKALSVAMDTPDPLNNLNPAVLQQLSSMGITPQESFPDHFARAYIRELQMSTGKATQGNAIAESAAAKVKAVNQMAQPSTGATPDQKPKTQNDKLLDAMNATAGGQAHKDVFG